MADWYYTIGPKRGGPVDEEIIRRLIETGHVTRDDYLWHEQMTDWEKAGLNRVFADSFASLALGSEETVLFARASLAPPMGKAFRPIDDVTFVHDRRTRHLGCCLPLFPWEPTRSSPRCTRPVSNADLSRSYDTRNMHGFIWHHARQGHIRRMGVCASRKFLATFQILFRPRVQGVVLGVCDGHPAVVHSHIPFSVQATEGRSEREL